MIYGMDEGVSSTELSAGAVINCELKAGMGQVKFKTASQNN